jgi:hypothetical protein
MKIISLRRRFIHFESMTTQKCFSLINNWGDTQLTGVVLVNVFHGLFGCFQSADRGGLFWDAIHRRGS